MPNLITSDNALRAARFALDGLARQEEIIGQNLANVDTPGYSAQTVDFQAALKRALKDDDSLTLQTTRSGHINVTDGSEAISVLMRQGGAARADGNNVDIDVEMMQMTETEVNYRALTQLVSKKLALLKTLATGR